MSRVGKRPVAIPSGVIVTVTNDNYVTVKGTKGELVKKINDVVAIEISNHKINIKPRNNCKDANMQSGTARALINNMVIGVSQGFEKKLQLVGVGYRAKAQNNSVNLTLGFSHPINHTLPVGVMVETPSQTEIILRGANKELVGKVAADIRSYRKPSVYKGKGVRYVDERVITKEAKKK